MGNNLELIGTGDKLLNRTPIDQTLRSRINKWDLMKLKVFSKSHEELKKLDSSKPNNLILKNGVQS